MILILGWAKQNIVVTSRIYPIHYVKVFTVLRYHCYHNMLLCYSGANKAMLKVAHMCAQLQKYDKSIQLFEEVRMCVCVRAYAHTSMQF